MTEMNRLLPPLGKKGDRDAYFAATQRMMDIISRRHTTLYGVDVTKPVHCTISKDLPTDIGGSDVAICGEGAPVAASSEDDDGGGGDDPDSDRRHSSLHSASRLRAPQLLRLADVKARTGLSRTTIYRFIADGRFPRNFPIGARAVAWLESDITQWIVDHANAHMLA
ncbi:AlpA family transcriptional regulator [Burkholderia pseudomallei]|uniref:AlpA family transcriptional regulator n=1 Tax=Burkholderia pseudomallei TaxID=28450 RepID=UPI00057253F2|nr:AlpA family transcriptional regulator [Burkholderia pseudomallei]